MKFRAKPVIVDAYKIVDVAEPDILGNRVVGCIDGAHRTATPDMMVRMIPAVGDYWVVQSDGYAYLNPKDVFERKYEPLATVDTRPVGHG